MYCKYCGEIIDEDSLICKNCGKKVKANDQSEAYYKEYNDSKTHNYNTSSGKSRVAAGILALLLGGIGVHNFYMGKILRGIIDILFCWTCIPAFVAFIQGIIILCESDKDFENRLKD